MRTSDTLLLALRMFRTRPLRTALTVLGVSVGIGTVFFLVSLGYGLQQTILNRIANAETLLTLDVNAGSDAIPLSDESIQNIRSMETVESVSRLASFSAQVSIASLTSDVQIDVLDDSFFRLSGVKPIAGSFFSASESSGAVLSAAAVKLFGLSPQEAIGKHAQYVLYLPSEDPNGRVFVREWSGSTLITGVSDNEDASRLILPFAAVSTLPITHYDQLKVKVRSQASLVDARATIIGRGFVVASLSDTIDQASKIFGIIQIILGFFGLVALVVSAIGMFNTMTIALLERTNEIGIMRSIGMTKRDIRHMFIVESMAMGFLGGLGGIALGAIAGQGVNIIMNMLAHRFNGPAVDLFLSPTWFIIVIICFSAFIGFLTGVYPSLRAGKLNPLDALRYK